MSTRRTDQLQAGDIVKVHGVGPREISATIQTGTHRWTVLFTNGAKSLDIHCAQLWMLTSFPPPAQPQPSQEHTTL